MGASGWSYFVPYQKDVGKALEELRQQEFEAGRYNQLTYLWPEKRMPVSIDELMEWNETEGTHSIIDVFWGVADEPGTDNFGMATPLSTDELMEFFGTEQPTHEMIVEHEDELMDFRSRWEATYVIVYKDGQPDEIFFTGFSGD